MNKLQQARIRAAKRRWAREDAERGVVPTNGNMKGDLVDVVFVLFALLIAAGVAFNM